MARVPSKEARFCYAEPYTCLGPGMRPRYLVFITLLALCHLQLRGQALTNASSPAPQNATAPSADNPGPGDSGASLPDDPGQELLPVAQPEPAPATGVPVEFEAQRQTCVGDLLTLTGDVVIHYRDYVLRADKVIYHQSTTELEAEGHCRLPAGPTMCSSTPTTATCA